MFENIQDISSTFDQLADSLGSWRPETRSQMATRLTHDYVNKKMKFYQERYLSKPKAEQRFCHLDKQIIGQPIIINYAMQEEFASQPSNLPSEVNKHNQKVDRRQWNDVEPAWRAADPRRRLSWPEFCRDFMGQNYGAIAQNLMSLSVSPDKQDNIQFLKFMMEMGKQGNPQSMSLDVNAKVEQRASMYAVLANMASPLDQPADPDQSVDLDQPTDPDQLADLDTITDADPYTDPDMTGTTDMTSNQDDDQSIHFEEPLDPSRVRVPDITLAPDIDLSSAHNHDTTRVRVQDITDHDHPCVSIHARATAPNQPTTNDQPQEEYFDPYEESTDPYYTPAEEPCFDDPETDFDPAHLRDQQ